MAEIYRLIHERTSKYFLLDYKDITSEIGNSIRKKETKILMKLENVAIDPGMLDGYLKTLPRKTGYRGYSYLDKEGAVYIKVYKTGKERNPEEGLKEKLRGEFKR